jgi:four helix bundle protein
MGLVERVYQIVQNFPDTERFALAGQMRRCSVSIPSNIAEGQKRYGTAETRHFCSIALGSAAELETQLQLAGRLYKIDTLKELQICEEISKMLTGLIKALRTKN